MVTLGGRTTKIFGNFSENLLEIRPNKLESLNKYIRHTARGTTTTAKSQLNPAQIIYSNLARAQAIGNRSCFPCMT